MKMKIDANPIAMKMYINGLVCGKTTAITSLEVATVLTEIGVNRAVTKFRIPVNKATIGV